MTKYTEIASIIIITIIIITLTTTIIISSEKERKLTEENNKLKEEVQLYRDWINDTKGLEWIFLTYYEKWIENENNRKNNN